jgi:hypothetical protein
MLEQPPVELALAAAELAEMVGVAQLLSDELHSLPRHHAPRLIARARQGRARLRLLVKSGQQLVEELRRHDRDDIVLKQHLVGTPLRRGAHEIAGRLVDQARGVLNPLLRFRPEPKLKPL